MNKWQAVVFDLDDTLYPERDFVLSGFRAVADWADTHLGIQQNRGYADLCKLYESGVRGDTFNRWLAAHGHLDAAMPDKLIQVYRQHTPLLTPFSDVAPLLHRLQGYYRLGLVSDGYLDVQRRKLLALGIGHYLDAIVFSDEWGREAWKPSTRPFQVVLQRLAIPAATAIYVADNPLKDFLGARQVGMFTVRIQRYGGEYAHLVPPSPHYAPNLMIHELTDLETLLS